MIWATSPLDVRAQALEPWIAIAFGLAANLLEQEAMGRTEPENGMRPVDRRLKSAIARATIRGAAAGSSTHLRHN